MKKLLLKLVLLVILAATLYSCDAIENVIDEIDMAFSDTADIDNCNIGNHCFGSWKTPDNRICGQSYREYRTCNLCGYVEKSSYDTQYNHYFGSWETPDNRICGQSYREYRTCLSCGYVEESSYYTPYNHAYGKLTYSETAPCGSYLYRECELCGDIEYDWNQVKHSPDENYVCTDCGLSVTYDELYYAEKTYYINGWSVNYNSSKLSYEIKFRFKEENQTLVKPSARVHVRIVNDNGATVYENILQVNKYSYVDGYARVYVPISEIEPSDITSGILYFCVDNPGYFSFFGDIPEAYTVSSLPLQTPTISFDELPLTYVGSNGTLTITDITCTSSSTSMMIYLSGEVPATESTSNKYYNIEYKLYDSSGYVVASGSISTDHKLTAGDKFNGVCITYYNATPGETYTLVLVGE